MSFWTETNYKVRLVDFVERFVAHNTTVKLFKKVIHKTKYKWGSEYILLWSGMDWQITEDYINSDYFRCHPDVEPCPFSENNVVAITSVGVRGEFADEASIVIDI